MLRGCEHAVLLSGMWFPALHSLQSQIPAVLVGCSSLRSHYHLCHLSRLLAPRKVPSYCFFYFLGEGGRRSGFYSIALANQEFNIPSPQPSQGLGFHPLTPPGSIIPCLAHCTTRQTLRRPGPSCLPLPPVSIAPQTEPGPQRGGWVKQSKPSKGPKMDAE